MASNNDGALRAQLCSVGIHDLFSPAALMDSGVEGVAKPDPELPLRAARALGVTPSRCLFVGDVDRVDGAAARAAGMPFALLDPLGQERPARPLVIRSLAEIEERFVASEG
jgi:putative hydrolase of the HAD superfamily